jgi:DNA modification methylase
MRTVWDINCEHGKTKHLATFPRELVRRCIKSIYREGAVICDPYAGTGTTMVVAEEFGLYNWIMMELSEDYCKIIEERLKDEVIDTSTLKSVIRI